MNRWILTLTILLAPALASAQGTESSPSTSLFSQAAIAGAVRAEVARSAQTPAPPGTRTQSSWIKRHPVVFGAIVGAGAGAVIGVATLPEDRNPDWGPEMAAFAGSAWGAGLGAVGGWIISAATK